MHSKCYLWVMSFCSEFGSSLLCVLRYRDGYTSSTYLCVITIAMDKQVTCLDCKADVEEAAAQLIAQGKAKASGETTEDVLVLQ